MFFLPGQDHLPDIGTNFLAEAALDRADGLPDRAADGGVVGRAVRLDDRAADADDDGPARFAVVHGLADTVDALFTQQRAEHCQRIAVEHLLHHVGHEHGRALHGLEQDVAGEAVRHDNIRRAERHIARLDIADEVDGPLLRGALQKLMETLERNGLGDSPYYVALLQKEGESYETVMDIFKKYHFPEQAVYLVSWNEASWYAFILEKGGAGTRAAAMHLANDWQEERMLFAMTGRYESTGDVWKAMDCLTEKLMEQAADRVKAETAGNNMVIGKNMEQLCGRIVFYLRSLDREKVRTEIKEFYAGFREGAVEAKYLYAYHLMLAGEMMKLVIADGGVPADRLITDGAQLSVMARGYFHVSSLEEKTISYAEKLLDFLEEKKRMEGSNVVENVKEYMENNYEKELSLTYISEMFHINTSYFSKKFKEETGRNFIEYLTEIRLREAKRLLASTGLTIAQVGEHTGYREPKYFSRIFMKYTGMTPSSYREEKGINSNETKKNQVRNL